MDQEVQTKKCYRCQLIKSIIEFSKLKSSNDGFQNRCKKCHNELNHNWKLKNPTYFKKWSEINIKRKQQGEKQWYLKNIQRHKNNCKNWRLNNVEHDKQIKKEWKLKNRNKINIHSMKIYYENINHRIKHCCRTRIRLAIKNNQKAGHTVELLGCSIDQLKQHLESQFTENMSWDNYGQFGWHIDHIIPCYYYDLSDPVEQKQCFHYTNLQPLWWNDNLEKGKKLVP